MAPTPCWAGKSVLVLGYGNPGRQDDGLGPAAAEAIAQLHVPGVRVEQNYLLNIEDAADAAEHDCVLFVDAAESGPEPYAVRKVVPADGMTFTSHIVKPEDHPGHLPGMLRPAATGVAGWHSRL